jgi:hypothetical protein
LILALDKDASGSRPRRCEFFSTSERIALLAPPIRSKAQICHALRSLDQSLVRTKIGEDFLHGRIVPETTVRAPEGSPRGLFVEVIRPVFEQLVARTASGLGISGIGVPTATLETIREGPASRSHPGRGQPARASRSLRYRSRRRPGPLQSQFLACAASPYASGGANTVTANSFSAPVRVCGAPAGIVTKSPALISHSLPETRQLALLSIT